MHLLSISNLDYVMMIILFGIILIIAYSFRRKNPSNEDFLLIHNHKILSSVQLFSMASVGLIEFIVLSSYGAFAGIPALCLLIPLYYVGSSCFDYGAGKSALFSNINDGKAGRFDTRFTLACYGIFMLLAAGAVIMIMVSILKNVLGWEFGNSTLSLLGVVAVSLLIGGVISAVYNQFLVSVITGLLFVAVLYLSYQQIGADHLLTNLHNVALNNKLAVNTFTKLSLAIGDLSQLWLVFIGILVICLLNPLFFIKQKGMAAFSKTRQFSIRTLQLVFLIMIVLLGIFALATPNKQATIANKNIVTQQTRLADGSIGYVVKAVPSSEPTLARGIIPQQMSENNEVTAIDSGQSIFDYTSAGMVIIKQVLPLAFISLFIIVLLFYKSVSETLLFITTIIIRGFYVSLYNKSGEELENLWATRVFLFACIVMAMAIGLVFFRFFDIYYICGLLLVLGLPIILNILGLTSVWFMDLLCYIIIIAILLTVNINGVPSVVQLVPFHNFAQLLSCLTLGTTVFYILCSQITRLIVWNYCRA